VFLYIRRRDLLSSPVDLVFEPSGHHQVCRWQSAHLVPLGVKAVGGERPGVVFRGAVVAAQRVRVARQQFAFLPVRDLVPFRVDDADLVRR
jgi:hypothetical protein